MEKQMQCSYCKKLMTVTLVRNITNAGASNVFWLCSACEKNAGGAARWIAHDPIKNFGIDIDTIPIHEDGRVDRCEVCGSLGAQWHHWAPHHLFGNDAEKWPGAFLCSKHHTLWHDTVTPDMSKKKGLWNGGV
jgi:hypothetical protein